MTTFREYVLSVRPPKPSFGYGGKYAVTSISIVTLFILGGIFGFPNPSFTYHSPWFRLLWIGIIPLSFYANYCEKKEARELD